MYQIVEYVYRGTTKNNNRRKVGCMIAKGMIDGVNMFPYFGYSAYNEKYEIGAFDYNKAEEIAEGRANKAFQAHLNKKLIPLIEKKDIPFSIRGKFDKFKNRAERYFKNKLHNVKY